MDIAEFKGYAGIASNSQISERYWLAKTLAHSRQAEANKVLLALTNDSNANVVSMAFWALAQRKDTRVIEKILEKMQASDDWYSQLYAYRALRSLGWNQSQSH
jgi:hypothetical protein